MAIIKYPYTNLHELNLDWIIEQLNNEGAVLSVNDKHGIVVLTGEDIKRNSTTPETVAQALSSQGTAIQTVRTQIGTTPLPTTAQSLTGAIAENAQEIADIEDNVIGSTALPTTAQTLTGAIAENAQDISTNAGNISNVSGDITTINNKIGNTALPTTAQTLTGAIAEHESDITKLYAITQLHSGFLSADDEATLSEPITNFNFVMLLFRSNNEMKMQLLPTSVALTLDISETIMAGTASGQVTYPPAYFRFFPLTSAVRSRLHQSMP